MAFFMVIGCSWLVIAGMLLWSHRRSEDPTSGQWRSEPSTFFGGPQAEAKNETKSEVKSSEEPPAIAAGGPAPVPAATSA